MGVPLGHRALRSVGLFQHGFTVPTRHPVAKPDSNDRTVPGSTRDSKMRSFLSSSRSGLPPSPSGEGIRPTILVNSSQWSVKTQTRDGCLSLPLFFLPTAYH